MEFAQKVAAQVEFHPDTVRKILQAFADVLVRELANGKQVRLPKIGRFLLRYDPPRRVGLLQSKGYMMTKGGWRIAFRHYGESRNRLRAEMERHAETQTFAG